MTGMVNRVSRYLLCCRLLPVVNVRNGNCSNGIDQCGDKHSFITRENSLAESQWLRALVDGLDGTGTCNTVGLIRERLGNGTILSAIKATVLLQSQ